MILHLLALVLIVVALTVQKRRLGGDPKHPMARGRHRVPEDAVPQPIGHYPGTVTAAPFEVSI